jgi:hypothetical protein
MLNRRVLIQALTAAASGTPRASVAAAAGVLTASAKVVPLAVAVVSGKNSRLYQLLDMSRIVGTNTDTPFAEAIKGSRSYFVFEDNGWSPARVWSTVFPSIVLGNLSGKTTDLDGLAYLRLSDITEQNLLTAKKLSGSPARDLTECLAEVTRLQSMGFNTIGEVHAAISQRMIDFLPGLLSSIDQDDSIGPEEKHKQSKELQSMLHHGAKVVPQLYKSMADVFGRINSYFEKFKIGAVLWKSEKNYIEEETDETSSIDARYSVEPAEKPESEWEEFTIMIPEMAQNIPTRVDFHLLRLGLCKPDSLFSDPYRPADIKVDIENEDTITVSTRDQIMKEYLYQCMDGKRELIFPRFGQVTFRFFQ